MNEHRDAIVIGGGLLGLLTAYELAERHWSVRVFEAAAATARQASWAGGGILSPLRPWNEPESVQALVQTSLQRTQALLQQHGALDTVQYRQCGMLVRDPERHAEDWARQLAVDWRRDHEGLFLPGVAQLRTPRYGRFAHRLAQAAGVQIQTHAKVQSIVQNHRGGVGVKIGASRLWADIVCVCAGAWSQQLLPASALRVEPVRGQMITIQADDCAPPSVIQSGSTYLVPRSDGLTLVGSTLEHTGFDAGTTPEAAETLLSAAQAMWPLLRGRPVVHHWAGLRPKPSTGAPMIGPHPSMEGVWMNTGHYRNGVTLAAGSAQALASAVVTAYGPP